MVRFTNDITRTKRDVNETLFKNKKAIIMYFTSCVKHMYYFAIFFIYFYIKFMYLHVIFIQFFI